MASHALVPFDFKVLLFGGAFSVAVLTTYLLAYYGGPYVIFAYNCFLKPIHTPSEKVTGQQAALESFYKGQAAIYDATRARLLRGREEMLALAAAQLTLLNKREGHRKRVWVDVSLLLLLMQYVAASRLIFLAI
jgi:betaine lipid synthase